MKKRILTSLLAIMLVASLSAFSANAAGSGNDQGNGNSQGGNSQGVSDNQNDQGDDNNQCIGDQGTGLTPAQLQETQQDVVNDILNDPTVSADFKQKVKDKIAAANRLSLLRGNTISVFLAVKPIMQDTNTYCSAATIKQTLTYINGSYGTTQASIISSTGAGPGDAAVIKYVNAHESRNPYMLSGNLTGQSDLDNKLNYDVTGGYPMIFHMKNNGSTAWPFPTDGHYTNISGKDNGTGKYRIIDPYYFSKYTTIRSGDTQGIHDELFTTVWAVNGLKFSPYHQVTW